MLLPALLLLLFDVQAPRPTAPVQTHDLEKLTWHQARQLHGQAVRVVFTVESLTFIGEDGVNVLVYAESGTGLSVTILFESGLAPEGVVRKGSRFTVEGQLVAQHFPGRLIDGQQFKDVLSVDIRGARVVKP
jgi:hypothetical protein